MQWLQGGHAWVLSEYNVLTLPGNQWQRLSSWLNFSWAPLNQPDFDFGLQYLSLLGLHAQVVARILLNQFRKTFYSQHLIILDIWSNSSSLPLVSDQPGLSSARILSSGFNQNPSLPLMSPLHNFPFTDPFILLCGYQSLLFLVVLRTEFDLSPLVQNSTAEVSWMKSSSLSLTSFRIIFP